MKYTLHRTRLQKLYLVLTLSFVINKSYAADYFNPALLELNDDKSLSSDLSIFENGGQVPGVYRVDIYVNEKYVQTADINFEKNEGAKDGEYLKPCLTADKMRSLGIATASVKKMNTEQGCVDLSAIPDAGFKFVFGSQKLLLSIPQTALDQNARGYIPPELWDEGITALMLNYSLSGSNDIGGDAYQKNSLYANLRPGINYGPWRLRNYTTFNRTGEDKGSWETLYTYVKRDIASLGSQLTVGDSTSPPDVFDTVPFRGIQLSSDEDMLPDSLKGYAPLVRGIARTNAQVIIRQNGYIIYQGYVSPGAFVITDMYPTGGGGDLDVTIKESDGSEQHQIVPFASLPILQREGYLKYSATAGRYRSYDRRTDATPYAQITGIYGIPWGMTLYGGIQKASPYQAFSFGIGRNIGNLGALSIDATHANARPNDKNESQGNSYRFRYSKNFTETGTNFTIAGYRYSTSGYYSLQETLDTFSRNNGVSFGQRKRNRAEIVVNQNLAKNFGAIYLTAVKEDYWQNNKSLQSFGFGYSNGWRGISGNINYTFNKNNYGWSMPSRLRKENDHIFALNISVPFNFMSTYAYANYSMSKSSNSATTNRVGLSGSSLEDRNLNWSVQQGYTNQGQGNSGNLNLSYKGGMGEINGGYGYDNHYKRLDYGVSGGMVLHENGLTLGQQLGETFFLVKAPGAKNVRISNQSGVKTDGRCYALYPYASPYRKNDITLDSETFADDVELSLNTLSTIPTRGAIARVSFEPKIGNKVLMTLKRKNGSYVPFGATVTDLKNEGTQGFIVGDNGQAYITGLPKAGSLFAKWGGGEQQRCTVNYQLDEEKIRKGILMTAATCE